MGVLTTASRLRRLALLAVSGLLALMMLGTAPVAAAAQSASGAEIRAAFLLNFAKFVEWPVATNPPGGTFVIGILGDDAVADALRDLVRGKSTGGRPLLARRVTTKDALVDLHVLFIGTSEGGRLTDVLGRTNGGSVLTVSDLDRFCQLGGTIQFHSERDRIRFDINLGQAERSGLVIHSKLLALAKTVFHSPKPPGVLR